MKRMLLMVMALLSLSACIEIKDPNQEQNDEGYKDKSVIVEKAQQLIVDQPMYLYEGRVLTQAQFESEKNQFLPRNQIRYKYDYLEIQSEGILYTLGQDVRLDIKKLSSEGQIATFPEGAEAPKGVAGRDGGSIDMRIGEAEGTLRFWLRGESGGQGLDGGDPDEALRGQNGESLEKAACNEDTRRRAWGKRGAKGYPGGDGLPGGNSGVLKLVVINGDEFSAPFSKMPGKGGKPGIGNPRGGPQGRHGAAHCFMVSNTYEDPSMVGEPGDDGRPGRDGIEEKNYIDEGRKTIR